jgi:hypothetical protein
LRTAGLALWRSLPSLGLAFTAACVEPDVQDDSFPKPLSGIAELTIDSGARVELEPGSGVGVVMEYAGDGQWTLSTLCDTAISEETCLFDILVSSDEGTVGIPAFEGLDLEANDAVSAPDPFAVQGHLETGADLDQIRFETAPGAIVRLSALLYDPILYLSRDWIDDPRMISWVGHGALQWGAPTNPVDLAPDLP